MTFDARHRALLLALLLALAALATATPSQAATLTVTTTADHDDGTCNVADCTLREAIAHANPGDGIDVPAGTFTLSLGQLDVTTTVTVLGAGARSTTIDAAGASRVVQVESTATATLSGLTVTGGSADIGGGIKVFGTLNLNDSAVTGNSATVSGGGIDANGTVNVTTSTIAGNHATGPGFAIGGGIDCFCSAVSVVNSTIAGNTASGGTGNAGGGILYSSGIPMTLLNATIAGNSASSAGGIDVQGTISAFNTIIAGNTSGDCNGALSSQGDNLSSDHSCGLTAGGDLQDTDPLLTTLQDNGGPTDTLAPGAGSPAIDAADNLTCPPTDQRGVSRPQGFGCDIGAVEVTGGTAVTAPAVTTGAAGAVTSAGAVLTGTVDPHNGTTTSRFELGTTTAYGQQVPGGTTSGTGAQPVSATATGLAPATTYHYRLVAANPAGTSFGGDATFRTLPSASLKPEDPTDAYAKPGTFTAHAGILTGGQTFRYLVEYGRTRTYGRTTALTSGGPQDQVLSVVVTSDPGVLLHYRFVVTMGDGSVLNGPDQRIILPLGGVTRYFASPGGTAGHACTNEAAPCDIATALADEAGGTFTHNGYPPYEVILEPGAYTLPTLDETGRTATSTGRTMVIGSYAGRAAATLTGPVTIHGQPDLIPQGQQWTFTDALESWGATVWLRDVHITGGLTVGDLAHVVLLRTTVTGQTTLAGDQPACPRCRDAVGGELSAQYSTFLGRGAGAAIQESHTDTAATHSSAQRTAVVRFDHVTVLGTGGADAFAEDTSFITALLPSNTIFQAPGGGQGIVDYCGQTLYGSRTLAFLEGTAYDTVRDASCLASPGLAPNAGTVVTGGVFDAAAPDPAREVRGARSIDLGRTDFAAAKGPLSDVTFPSVADVNQDDPVVGGGPDLGAAEYHPVGALPRAVTGGISGATVSGSADGAGSPVSGDAVEYRPDQRSSACGLAAFERVPTALGAWPTSSSFTVTATDLVPGCRYFVRALAQGPDGVGFGAEKSLIAPTATPLGAVTATVSGSVATITATCPLTTGCTGTATVVQSLSAAVARSTPKPLFALPARQTVLATGRIRLAAHRRGRLVLRLTNAGRRVMRQTHRGRRLHATLITQLRRRHRPPTGTRQRITLVRR